MIKNVILILGGVYLLLTLIYKIDITEKDEVSVSAMRMLSGQEFNVDFETQANKPSIQVVLKIFESSNASILALRITKIIVIFIIAILSYIYLNGGYFKIGLEYYIISLLLFSFLPFSYIDTLLGMIFLLLGLFLISNYNQSNFWLVSAFVSLCSIFISLFFTDFVVVQIFILGFYFWLKRKEIEKSTLFIFGVVIVNILIPIIILKSFNINIDQESGEHIYIFYLYLIIPILTLFAKKKFLKYFNYASLIFFFILGFSKNESKVIDNWSYFFDNYKNSYISAITSEEELKLIDFIKENSDDNDNIMIATNDMDCKAEDLPNMLYFLTKRNPVTRTNFFDESIKKTAVQEKITEEINNNHPKLIVIRKVDENCEEPNILDDFILINYYELEETENYQLLQRISLR